MRKNAYLLLIMLVFLPCLFGCKHAEETNLNASSHSAVGEGDTTASVQGAEQESSDDEYSGNGSNIVEKVAVTESLSQRLRREIDDAYQEELQLPENYTTVGMTTLADKYTEKWKQVADTYYAKLMEYDGIVQPNESYYSSDDLHTFVSNMKENWEQYSRVQCENYAKCLQAIYGGGTITGPASANYEYEMQMEWALQLVAICQQLYIE